jgi:hypothetical protein
MKHISTCIRAYDDGFIKLHDNFLHGKILIFLLAQTNSIVHNRYHVHEQQQSLNWCHISETHHQDTYKVTFSSITLYRQIT